MIARTTRFNLSTLLGDLQYVSAASFPNWPGLVLIFYTLTVFELVPTRFTSECIPGWAEVLRPLL